MPCCFGVIGIFLALIGWKMLKQYEWGVFPNSVIGILGFFVLAFSGVFLLAGLCGLAGLLEFLSGCTGSGLFC
jgi:cytochrome c biogenesis protein CcdA